MEKIALKIGGIVFLLIGIVHVVRVVKNVPVMVGDTNVPMAASVLCAVIALGLGLWMLKLTCCCCCKK
jgi:type IV secretory pathway TrbD component